MRLLVLSDLHLETKRPYTPPTTEADVVVLAGDVDRGPLGVEWARATWPSKPVIYVAGNHEFCNTGRSDFFTMPDALGELRAKAAGTNVHFLENTEVAIGGVRFLGCTLWTDFGLFGDRATAMVRAWESMPEYVYVHWERQTPMRPENTLALHRESVAWLERRLAVRHDGPTVVVTHHAPSRQALSLQHSNDDMAPAFVSDLDRLCAGDRLRVWIHGHTHYSVDFEVSGTRVCSNQLGYAANTCSMYQHGLVVDLCDRQRGSSL